jgi:DNA helicase-2/ATP-dependent DNA helicase PcrA
MSGGKPTPLASSRLTLEQLEVVMQPPGPLAVFAGAGSGKTNTLVGRAIHMIMAEHIPPTNVLAITFSNAGVGALRERLTKYLGAAGEAVHVVTFHSFARWIVSRHYRRAGYSKAPSEREAVLEGRRLDDALLEALRRTDCEPPTEALLAAMHDAVNAARAARAVEGFIPYDPSHAAVLPVVERFEALRRERNLIDMPGMLLDAVRILRESDTALRSIQEAYQLVLADELQDIDVVQFTLLRMLVARHGNLTAMGDPMQTLYGFRGAEPRYLVNFADFFRGARVMTLTENFRSTGEIVAAANAIAALLPYGQQLTTANPPGDPPRARGLRDEEAEARFIAREVRGLLDGGVRPEDIAVLVRDGKHQAAPLKAALGEQRIPFGGPKAEQPKVRLGTIHASKGEEWVAVFVAGFEERILPSRHALENQDDPGRALEAETCVAYVALTRARASLTITFCERRADGARSGGDADRECHPSRFLRVLSGNAAGRRGSAA